MTDDRDELINQVRRSLAPLPAVSPSSVARVLRATAHRTPPSAWHRALEWVMLPSWSLARAGGLAVVALVLGFVARGARAPTVAPAASVATSAIGAPAGGIAQEVSADRGLVAVQLVFDAPRARTVSVVGDFNDWQPAAAPMRRLEAGQPWTAVVMVAPGRHAYAFLVDGTTWTADPRAPRAADGDFGKPGSVLFVQAP